MIKTETIKEIKETEKILSFQCDKCKKEFDYEVDIFEIQEFHHIHFVGGYGSVFGDETHVQCDLCQRCLMEIIGDICRYDGLTLEELKK